MTDQRSTILVGNAVAQLRKLPAKSVHCCITSPPYYALRDYGCAGQIGMETTPAKFIAALVKVFREVHRVLRDDGTLWINIGDSYSSGGNGGGGSFTEERRAWANQSKKTGWRSPPRGLKPKDMIGIPWMLAFALRADGWYLRDEIIWHKPSPMPSSVKDRTTRAHETLFLLAKSKRYYFDAKAIDEPASTPGTKIKMPSGFATHAGGHGCIHREGRSKGKANGTQGERRAKRSVWRIASAPYKKAHFATYPPKLIAPCILAGTSEYGCCPGCNTPWKRLLQTERRATRPGTTTKVSDNSRKVAGNRDPLRHVAVVTGESWVPCCDCGLTATLPAVVLDPFAGSGTTLAVANDLGRHAVGIELNPDYVPLIEERIAEVCFGARNTLRSKKQPKVLSREFQTLNMLDLLPLDRAIQPELTTHGM